MKKNVFTTLFAIMMVGMLWGQTQQGNRGTIAVIIENPNNIVEEFIMEALRNRLMNAFRGAGYTPVIRDASILARLDSVRAMSASGLIRQQDAVGAGLLLGEVWIAHVRILPADDQNRIVSVRQVMVEDGTVRRSNQVSSRLVNSDDAVSAVNAVASGIASQQPQQLNDRGTVAVIVEDPNNILAEFAVEILSNELMNAFRRAGYTPVIRDVSTLAQLDAVRARSESGEIRQEDAMSAGLLLGEEWICHVRVFSADGQNRMVSAQQVRVTDGTVPRSTDVARLFTTINDAQVAARELANRMIPSVAIRSGCNSDTPSWGSSLGTVTFDRRGHNTTIRGRGANSHIHQTWSGAVTATNCQKTAFEGGWRDNFNADCRSNPNNSGGDLFSWCAVLRFGHVLCPHPWRVPTRQDFVNLDIAMGGTGNFRVDLGFIHNHYVDPRGDRRNNRGSSPRSNHWDGAFGNYWSRTEDNEFSVFGFTLRLSTNGVIIPQATSSKQKGLMLRCVR